MKHRLTLSAAACYGSLIDKFAPMYMRPDFEKMFEEFLDAYDRQESTAKTSADKIPRKGYVYRDVFGNEYRVIDFFYRECNPRTLESEPVVVLENKSYREAGERFMLSLDEFLNPKFTKVD